MLAVLVDLVLHADEKGTLVRFVELSSADLDDLRDLCGPNFQIVHSDESEFSHGRLHLKNSSKEGVLLKAGVHAVRGNRAEAAGCYDSRSSTGWVALEYELRKVSGTWRVLSSRVRVAS